MSEARKAGERFRSPELMALIGWFSSFTLAQRRRFGRTCRLVPMPNQLSLLLEVPLLFEISYIS